MHSDSVSEARRQVEICNACRYCEGFCSVFPALQRQRSFAQADLSQLANLCVNCRGCYYACQYTAPHEFNLNLPGALAELRRESWERHAWPRALARGFHTRGVAIAGSVVIAFALLFALATVMRPESGVGFYAVMSHSLMVSLFLPAAALPLLSIGISLRRYWREVGGARPTVAECLQTLRATTALRALAAGHGEGCNYEDADRYSSSRRTAHLLTATGFLLCLASTTVATGMHYLLDWPAPYAWYTLPKLLGVSGGVLLAAGTAWLAWLKCQADAALGDAEAWGGEMAFVLLLCSVAVTGLALYALGGSAALTALLAIHLGTVMAFFLLLPYSKMVHAFYRFAAHLREEQIRAGR